MLHTVNKLAQITIATLFVFYMSACGTSDAQELDEETTVHGYSNISNNKVKALLQQKVTLIDIRRREEWLETGIVEGAKTLTFFDKTGRINPNFVPQLQQLVKPDQPVMLICRTGNRTRAASQAIANQLGYKTVYNVKYGIMGWIAKGQPVVKYQP